eukprot:7021763-Pyramimonas_sp.AAC.1
MHASSARWIGFCPAGGTLCTSTSSGCPVVGYSELGQQSAPFQFQFFTSSGFTSSGQCSAV